MRRWRMFPVRAREVAPIQQVHPLIEQGRSEWARWRVWIIAGPVLFAVCVGLLVYAIGVTS